jgi:hypothetical protein
VLVVVDEAALEADEVLEPMRAGVNGSLEMPDMLASADAAQRGNASIVLHAGVMEEV